MKIAGRILALLFAVVLFGLAIANMPLTLQALEEGTAAGQGLAGVSEALRDIYLSDQFWQKNQFVNINGLHARLSGRRELNDVVLMRNGMLGYAGSERHSMSPQAAGIAQFARWLEAIGTDFLYVQLPYKLDLEKKMLPLGYEDSLHENTSELLELLAKKNVATLDLRKDICATTDQVDSYFYATDHHWSASGAMKAFQLILARLQEMYPQQNIANSEEAYPSSWKKHELSNYFLGSQGKRVGQLYAGVDDLVWYTPRFATSMSMCIPKYERFTSGTFQDAVMLMHYVEEPADYFNLSPYNVYIGGDYPLVVHRNGMAPVDMKVLIIKDSFTLPLQSFMSTVFTAVEVIDPRHYTEKTIAEYIRQNSPDLVMLSPNASVIDSTEYYRFDTPDAMEYYELTPVYSAPVQVKAKPSEQYNYTTVPVALEANTLYQVALDGLHVTDGDADGIQLLLYNERENSSIDSWTIDLDYYARTGDNTWYFRTTDAADSNLIIYAGIRGQTEGIGVTCSNLTLSKATAAYPDDYIPEFKPLVSEIDITIYPQDDFYNYEVLTDELEGNAEYTLTIDSANLDAGETESTMLALFDAGLNELVDQQPVTFSTTGDDRIIWTFRTPEEPQGQLSLLLYAGMPGKTVQVGVTYRNLTLVKNLIPVAESAPAPQVEEAIDTPLNENSDSKVITSELPQNQSFTMPAKTSNYNFNKFPIALNPGSVYTLTIDSLELTEGATDVIDVTLFDQASDVHLAEMQFSLSQQENFRWTFRAPEGSQDCMLLVYAGKRGATGGISLSVNGLTLAQKTDLPDGEIMFLQDVVIEPSEDNYNYKTLDIAFEPNTTYQFSVDEVIFQGKASDVLPVSLYDQASKTHLALIELPLAESRSISGYTWTFATPDGDSSMWKLLVYAGERSTNAGIGALCRNLLLIKTEDASAD